MSSCWDVWVGFHLRRCPCVESGPFVCWRYLDSEGEPAEARLRLLLCVEQVLHSSYDLLFVLKLKIVQICHEYLQLMP